CNRYGTAGSGDDYGTPSRCRAERLQYDAISARRPADDVWPGVRSASRAGDRTECSIRSTEFHGSRSRESGVSSHGVESRRDDAAGPSERTAAKPEWLDQPL